MLKIGIVEDELGDLLPVISNLRALDPSGERIGIVALLMAADSPNSIEKEAAMAEKYLRAALAAKGVGQLVFPKIASFGQADMTQPEDRARVLDRLAQDQVELILSDSWMGNEFAGVMLLDAALAEPRWAAQAWQGWLMTKHDRVAVQLFFDPPRAGKFDPYRCHLDKRAIIRTTLGECDLRLADLIEQAEQQKQASNLVRGLPQFELLVGASPSLNGPNGVYELIEVCAQTISSVLITGESGTGKDLAAQSIHKRSSRPGRIVSINCSALPETLLESELFGHVKGAFTGAQSTKDGLFKAADGGTLFLDEIGEMSQAMQVKLLRTLEDKRIRPVGSTIEIPVDVRIIAATKQNLPKMIGSGQFREDLYYRISVICIEMPTLRGRREDIPLLTHYFVGQLKGSRLAPVAVTKAALDIFQAYDWPGNVRELRSRIEEALAFTREGQSLNEENPVIKRLAEEARRRASTGSLPPATAIGTSVTDNQAGSEIAQLAGPKPSLRASFTPALDGQPPPATSISAAFYRNKSAAEIWDLIKQGMVVKNLPEWVKLITLATTLELVDLVIQDFHGHLPNDEEAKKYFNMTYTAWKGWVHRNKKEPRQV